MQVSIVIAAYFGDRDFQHPKYYSDKLFYVKTQLDYINISNVLISKIYIICTYQNVFYKNAIENELIKLSESDSRIVILHRENLGGSYCSWHAGLNLDSGFSDYMVLIEDDYTIYSKDSLNYMLEYFNKNPNLFYLCQYWTNKPYHLVHNSINEMVNFHAAMSCGMINVRLYNECLKNGIDFRLVYDEGKNASFVNQVLFLENYRKNGYEITDFRKEYSSIFAQDIIEYGNPNGEKIILPIIEQFFN